MDYQNKRDPARREETRGHEHHRRMQRIPNSWVFQYAGDRQFYYVVTGRWFRAPQLRGPWTYAGNDLPEDYQLD